MTEKTKPTGLELLRQPFPANRISKLPKPTKAQTEEVRNNFKEGIRCKLCGAWHHKDVVHLDYVGHAALTDRLLDADPAWNWEPVALNPAGTPATDENGGMWIRLTVCGVTRLGYGHPDGKRGGDAVKELIGDALRNAAMRFGAALDLWHKGDLHGIDDEAEKRPSDQKPPHDEKPKHDPTAIATSLIDAIGKAATAAELEAGNADGTKFAKAWQWLEDNKHTVQAAAIRKAYDERMARLNNADINQDEIPY